MVPVTKIGQFKKFYFSFSLTKLKANKNTKYKSFSSGSLKTRKTYSSD